MARTKQTVRKSNPTPGLANASGWDRKQLLGGASDGVHHIRDTWRKRKRRADRTAENFQEEKNEVTEQPPQACLRQIIPANRERWP